MPASFLSDDLPVPLIQTVFAVKMKRIPFPVLLGPQIGAVLVIRADRVLPDLQANVVDYILPNNELRQPRLFHW